MLKPGIKLGPGDWQQRLAQSQARYCEVWFNVNKAEDYQPMLEYLQRHGIHTGLHFWGILPGHLEPNLAYPGPTLAPTLALIKTTIDIASNHGFTYVNVHSGNTKLIRIDLDRQIFIPDKMSPATSLAQAEATQRQSLLKLNAYAKRRRVLLLVESVPAKAWVKDKAINQYSLPVASIFRRSQEGIHITNDLCHVLADQYDKPLNQLWQALWRHTVDLAPMTKLIHVNTVTPPYNGTDTHGGITSADFALPGTFPTRSKLQRLLRLFADRDDVWVITEPTTDHVQNYHALVKLLEENATK